MLVYESEYPDSLELMTDAYNRAHDLRFQTFYTDRQKLDWKGFNFDFEKKIRGGLGGRDIRLKHSPFANDFVLGKDTIRRFGGQKAFFDLPRASILVDQLSNIQPQDMDTDHPEYKFHAINAFRYLLVAWRHENASAAHEEAPGTSGKRPWRGGHESKCGLRISECGIEGSIEGGKSERQGSEEDPEKGFRRGLAEGPGIRNHPSASKVFS